MVSSSWTDQPFILYNLLTKGSQFKGSKSSDHASLIKKIPALISVAVQASWNISSQYLGQKMEETFAEC